MTLDGYVATKDGDLSFLDAMHIEGEDYGYAKFTESIDTVILGRKTYDKVLSFGIPYPHADKKTFVISRSKTGEEGNVRFYSGNVKDLVLELKNQNGKNIYCDGGPELVNTLLQENLIDEIILSVIPVLLGEGIPLFNEGFSTQNLTLLNSKSYSSGLVQMHYELK